MAQAKERPHKKGRRKVNPIGRHARPTKHRLGQACGHKGCRKLMESRQWDRSLGAYVPKGE